MVFHGCIIDWAGYDRVMSMIRAKFRRPPGSRGFNAKTDINWGALAKALRVRLVEHGGVQATEAPAGRPGLVFPLGILEPPEQGGAAGGAGGAQEGRRQAPDRIFVRQLTDGSLLMVQENGRVWLEGPEFINIRASDAYAFSAILTRHASHGLSPVATRTYDAQADVFQLSREGEGLFSGYDLLASLFEARKAGLDLSMTTPSGEAVSWVVGPAGGMPHSM
jgi:hypothetical protein